MPAHLTLLPGGLSDEQAHLQALHREIGAAAPEHPVLRWTPRWAPDQRAQHRLARGRTAETACGVSGMLVVAAVDDPPCRDCFPGVS